MYKKRIVLLFISLLMAFTVSAQQVKKVAILAPIDREDKVEYFIELLVRGSLTEAISSTEGFESIERVNVSEVMDEHEFERTGMVNDDQIRRLGQLSGADFILISEVAMGKSNNIIVTARIVDVETGGIGKNTYQVMGSEDYDVLHGCESLANRLLGLQDPYQEKVLSSSIDPKKAKEQSVVIKPEKPVMEEMPATMGKVKIGDVIEFSDGNQGMVFYISPEGKGLVVSLNEGKEPWDYNRRSEDIEMLDNYENECSVLNYGEGENDTKILCSALGDDARAAFWCRVQGENWYLPSMGEFYMLTIALKEYPTLATILKTHNGGEIDGWYWTSSEYNKKEAWNVSGGGWISTERKSDDNKIRAIRCFTAE